MDKIFVGIDPGKTGGVSILRENGEVIASIIMPIINEKEMDVVFIHNLIKNLNLCDIICGIEKAQAVPGQGVTGMFNYGKGYGELIGMLKILKIKFYEIPPQRWKKDLDLNIKKNGTKEITIKDKKMKSVELCEFLFPSEKVRGLKGGLIDGKAESLLIAEHTRRKYK